MVDFPTRTITEKLVTNVLETRPERLDEETVQNAKKRVMDTVGCMIAGARAPGNPQLLELVKQWGGNEEATIFVHGLKVPAQNAAMMNSIMARSFDSEPIGGVVFGRPLPSHMSGTTVMTAITMADMTGASGKELITALVAGEDFACRVLAAAPARTHTDNTGTINVFGATAIAGRLMGLDHFQLRNSLGIALHHMAGSYQSVWDGTYAFKLSQGISARSGVFSAQLAKAGWTAAEDPLLGKFAYYHFYTQGVPDTDILTKDLGKRYLAENQFKPFPSCRFNHGPVECALALVQKHHIKIPDIKEIVVHVSRRGLSAAVGRPFEIGAFPYANALFSYQYTVASALVRGVITPDHFSEGAIRDPKVNALIGKIRLTELSVTDEDFLAAKVEVFREDGKMFSEFTAAPKGDDARNRLSKEEMLAKFMLNVRYSGTVSLTNAEQVIGLLDRLDELDNVREMVHLLTV